MPSLPTRELLDGLLVGEAMAAEYLDELLARRTPEDQYLEFKDGALLKDPKRARDEVRHQVCGFANADGGVLIVGVSEGDPRSIAPCSPVGGAAPADWAANVLADLMPLMSPPARIQTVNHRAGTVLVIAVPRAAQLIPGRRAGAVNYSFRFHGQTNEAPDYLVSDLVLGRRQRPSLEVSSITVSRMDHGTCSANDGYVFETIKIFLSVEITNQSMVPADSVKAGLLTWGLPEHDPLPSVPLLQHVSIEAPGGWKDETEAPWSLNHCKRGLEGGGTTIDPLDVEWVSMMGPITFYHPLRIAEVEAALYLLPRGSPPQWYQVSFQIEGVARFGSLGRVGEVRWARVEGEHPRLGFRVVVVVHFADRGDSGLARIAAAVFNAANTNPAIRAEASGVASDGRIRAFDDSALAEAGLVVPPWTPQGWSPSIVARSAMIIMLGGAVPAVPVPEPERLRAWQLATDALASPNLRQIHDAIRKQVDQLLAERPWEKIPDERVVA